MLTKTNLKTIKQTLEDERASLTAFLEKKQRSIYAEDLSNPDNTDRAMASRTNNRELLLIDQAKRQLEDIDQSLNRLETGTYGICQNCGGDIQPARLEVMPTAALCVDCQSVEDNK
jgi:DnaK suppressor protein